ncbi:MAG: hypothetical protein Q4F65_04890 [Propionibacteriaceae bacterium]|nr:hypothetical protein [Propionibacteriaceae bacterium]
MTNITKLVRLAAASALVGTATLVGAGAAQAAEPIPQGVAVRLSQAQLDTLENLNTPARVSGGAASTGQVSGAACGTRSKSATLYRGSFLMWAEDRLRFSHSTCTGKVTSSSLSQRAGYVFPNISKARGTSRYSATSTLHRWEGRYEIGAGVVTPWGDVRVYGADYSTDWQAKGSGSYSGRWEN